MKRARPLILVVEDEPRLAQLLLDYVQNSGWSGQWLADGRAVVPWIRGHEPDLVLLDVMLPGRDGMEICRELRGFSRVPIIMVSARVEEIDRLLGLELGADDYICKPFSPREVMARVRAVLRRFQAAEQQIAEPALVLDAERFRARMKGREIELTRVEFQLLHTMHAAPGRVFSRSQLMDRIYDDQRIVSDRTIDSHIKKLRRRLAELLPDQELVHSVYGAGYRYEMEPLSTAELPEL